MSLSTEQLETKNQVIKYSLHLVINDDVRKYLSKHRNVITFVEKDIYKNLDPLFIIPFNFLYISKLVQVITEARNKLTRFYGKKYTKHIDHDLTALKYNVNFINIVNKWQELFKEDAKEDAKEEAKEEEKESKGEESKGEESTKEKLLNPFQDIDKEIEDELKELENDSTMDLLGLIKKSFKQT